jgi:hypothetical protein
MVEEGNEVGETLLVVPVGGESVVAGSMCEMAGGEGEDCVEEDRAGAGTGRDRGLEMREGITEVELEELDFDPMEGRGDIPR